jgi:2'-5' RNA ligase
LNRSFLAIELPRPILQRIEEVQEELKRSLSDVRWVNPEKIHLTLKFFGNIEEGRVEPIVKSIEELIHATSPFHLMVRGVGAFPHLKNPRVIWMGLRDGEDVLPSFQKQLETQL